MKKGVVGSWMVIGALIVMLLMPMQMQAVESYDGAIGTELIIFNLHRDEAAEVYSIRPDGRGLTRLTYNGVRDWHPRISPDGRKIGLCRDEGGKHWLVLIDPTGGNERYVTDQFNCNSAWGWSPDSTQILSPVGGAPYFRIIEVETGDISILATGTVKPDHTDWSPDGTQVVFDGGPWAMWMIKIDGTELRSIGSWSPRVAEWSPDGTQIAFEQYLGSLHIVNSDGTGARRISTPTRVFAPTWSPDGTRLAYTNFGSQLRIVGVDGSNDHLVPNLPAGLIENADWGAIHTNAAPQLMVVEPLVEVDEGQAAQNSGTMIDADGDPVYLSASAGTITDDGNGVWSWSYDTSDGPANSQIITVSANDGNGGISEATFDLVVNNVAPTATFNAPPAVNEGDDIQLSLTGSYDPSSVDTAAGFQFAFDCGDGLGYGAWTSSNTGTCPTSGDGTRTVRGKTKDKDEGEAIYSAQIPVQDLAPLAAFTWNPAPQEEGFGVQFTDASTSYPDEIVSWLWDFGGQATSDEQHSGFTFMDNDEYQVCLTVTDDDGTQDTTCDQVIILDRTPTAAFAWSPEPQDEGSPVQFTDLSTSYPDGLVAWAWDFGDLDTSTDRHPAHSYLDDDVYTVCLTATDDDGSPDHVCHAVTINNIDPTVTLTGPISSDEGDTKSYIYTVSDPGTDTFELFNTSCGTSGELTNATFDSDTGSGSFDCTFLDGPATSDVSVTVNDDDGGIGTGSLEVIVNNIPPTINSITAPIDPLNVNDQPVTVEVAFSDPGTADTHEVTWDWADYTSDTHDGANSPAAQEHTYTEAGVYPVTVTVTDDDGGSDTVTYKFSVIYDPDDGFVTGGGWIWSEPGWCHLDDQCAEAEGKANFGFVSKYKKGAFVPTGNTEFNFKAGSLNYHSDSYDWLVVTGSDYAKFKGAGTINGEGDFKFMVWAGDGDPDTFRIRIWVEDELGNETDIYDNGFGEPIGGGNIVVHTR